MSEQEIEEEGFEEPEDATSGYCFLCKNERKFVPTQSPTGFWVCTDCHIRTSTLEEYVTTEEFKERRMNL